jgi:hypothetical protein
VKEQKPAEESLRNDTIEAGSGKVNPLKGEAEVKARRRILAKRARV